MKRDKILRNMAVISAVFSGISVLLGCICVIFPKWFIPAFFGYNFKNYSLGSAMPFMLIRALLPLSLFLLALVNIKSDTMKYNKGIITAVLTVVFHIINSVVGGVFYSVSLKICAYSGGTDMVSLLGGVNASLGFINWLNFFAVLILVSASAIEVYVSKKGETI
ncbi:MAG: hypothetical protein K2H19_07115 [Ruminococcus sp.]|nr:hypothetical protein [Ruminococcus sp.]